MLEQAHCRISFLQWFGDFFVDILSSFCCTSPGQLFSIAPILLPAAPILLPAAPILLLAAPILLLRAPIPTAPILLPAAPIPAAPILLPAAPILLLTAQIVRFLFTA